MGSHEVSVETPRTFDGRPNRLKGLRGYLCGAMDRVADGGTEWRIKLQEKLSDLEIIWLDPTSKPINIGLEDSENRIYRRKCKQSGNYDAVNADIRVIRNVDLRMVDLSDFLIVCIDLTVHQCGTYEELFLANREKKPIVTMVVQGKQWCPDWLIGTIPHEMIFSSWNEVHQYLRHVAHDPVIRTFKRWLFFNYDLCRRF
jgi:hypothetical protein